MEGRWAIKSCVQWSVGGNLGVVFEGRWMINQDSCLMVHSKHLPNVSVSRDASSTKNITKILHKT